MASESKRNLEDGFPGTGFIQRLSGEQVEVRSPGYGQYSNALFRKAGRARTEVDFLYIEVLWFGNNYQFYVGGRDFRV
jgi:hypothetical protein